MKQLGEWMALGTLYALFVLLLTHPQTAAAGAGEGLRLCAELVIPALFPFFVLSSMAVSLGAAALLGRLLQNLVGPLLRLGSGGCSALALGLLGGYPAGAQTVRELWERGQCSRSEAERALAFCNNCGPAFLLGAAGAGVFRSAAVGGVLLAGHWLGALFVGVLFRFYGKKPEKSEYSTAIGAVSLSAALTRSVQRALMATGNVCAYTVFFRVVVRLLEETGAERIFDALPNGAALFMGLLDLTGGVSGIDPGEPYAVELAALLMGWGGASVLCQTMAVLEDSGLRLRTALAGKLLHGPLAALWTHLLLRLIPAASVSVMAAGPGRGSAAAFPAVGALWVLLWIGWAVFVCFSTGKKGRRRV